MGKYIAIDYGKKRIGIAISDPDKIFSFPYKVISNKDFHQELSQIFQSQNITKIVIGYPKKLNNTDSDITKEVEQLYADLKKIYKEKTFLLFDERLTSSISKQIVGHSTLPKKKRQDKSLLDLKSAEIILQDYIDYEKIIKSKKK